MQNTKYTDIWHYAFGASVIDSAGKVSAFFYLLFHFITVTFFVHYSKYYERFDVSFIFYLDIKKISIHSGNK